MADATIRNRSGMRLPWRIIAVIAGACLSLYVFLPMPIYWAYFLAAPFIQFTFTDLTDFFFAGLIVQTLLMLAMRHWKKPYPAGWVTTATVGAAILAVVTPLVPIGALYLLSYRGQKLIGHWPQPMRDDPKFIGPDDPAYQMLQSAVVYASCFAGWGLYTWGALMVHLRRSLTTRRKLWLVGLFLLVWLVYLWDPDKRIEWWLD